MTSTDLFLFVTTAEANPMALILTFAVNLILNISLHLSPCHFYKAFSMSSL